MKKLQVGILSTARINRSVIPGIRASQRCELSAIASRDQARSLAFAAEWNIPRSYDSYEDLLGDPTIDVIYNPLPNHLHAEWTIKAAQAGKHVLCEKPIALTVSDVDSIAAAAAQANVTVVEAFMYRHHPMTLKVRELVETGSLGEVLYVRGTFSFLLNRPHDIRWQPESGGGSIWDIGCYPVSYALMVMGDAPTEVYGTQVIGESGVDVHFSGQLRFRNDRLAQVQSSFLLPFHTGIEIRGTRGTIQIPTPFNPKEEQISFTLITGDVSQEFSFQYPYLYQGEFDNLADVILDHAQARLPLSESRKIIATLVALATSARQNRPITLE